MSRVEHVRYLVVGAGPAGLQMAYFLQSRGRDYTVLERSERAGSFFETFPRHRTLISLNKPHNLFDEPEFNWRHDWNSLLSDDPDMRFTRYTEKLYPDADDIVRYFGDFARRWDLDIRFGHEVAGIRAVDGGYDVELSDGRRLTCEVLLLGTGPVSERRPDGIEGADTEGIQSYGTHDLDVERYRNKRVAVIGQGNSAFETADHLSDVAAYVHIFGKTAPRLAWDSHFVGDLRSINNNSLDLFHFKALHGYLTPKLRSITKAGDVFRTEHEYDYPDSEPPGTLCLTRDYDEVIFCSGFNFVPTDLFADGEAPATWHDGKFPRLAGDWQSVNRPNCHFIGAAMQGNDRTSASGFIHGFRYNVRTLWHLLEERFEQVPYPRVEGPFDWSTIEERFYSRVSLSAALYQQYGTLCDVITVGPDRTSFRWFEEMPLQHLPERDFGDDDAFVLTLEYGFHKHDRPPLQFTGPSDPNDPARAVFLHPVIRRLRDGVLDRDEKAEFHFGDSLLGRWDRPHASGGAVMPYHRKFTVWLHDELGVPAPPTAIADDVSAYRVWSPEEIEARRGEAASR